MLAASRLVSRQERHTCSMTTRRAGKAIDVTPNVHLEPSQREAALPSFHAEPGKCKRKAGRPPQSANEKADAYERKKQRQRDAYIGASQQRITTTVEAATTAVRQDETSRMVQGKRKVGRPTHSADEKAAIYEQKKQRQRVARTGASEQRITTTVERVGSRPSGASTSYIYHL